MRELNSILADWARLGVELAVSRSGTTPDIEALLVEAAGLLPDHARLLPISVTWVAINERLIARHRLGAMAHALGNDEQSACLGLLLSFAQMHTGTDHLSVAMRKCRPLRHSMAMLRAERSPAYLALVQEEASPISRRWGVLAPMPEIKRDALRPMEWILRTNPQLRLRALMGGALTASIAATLSRSAMAGASESSLSRACGATRKATREALDHLEFCGLVVRAREGARVSIRLSGTLHLKATPQGSV